MAPEYDFVIVGGGTAGLVVASRLSENPVFVLEAGESHLQNPAVATPNLWPSLLGTDVDWSLISESQVCCFSGNLASLTKYVQATLRGRSLKYPQGRLFGGTSALNTQQSVAPSESGIDI